MGMFGLDKRALLAAAVATAAAASAQAGASASVTYTNPGGFHITQATTRDWLSLAQPGELGFTLDTSGAVFSLDNVSVGLSRGQSVDLYYDYTITDRKSVV